jgi:hypothetical protein
MKEFPYMTWVKTPYASHFCHPTSLPVVIVIMLLSLPTFMHKRMASKLWEMQGSMLQDKCDSSENIRMVPSTGFIDGLSA